jgi:hypothetical protein
MLLILSFAIIEFDTAESRNAAFEANGSSIDGAQNIQIYRKL